MNLEKCSKNQWNTDSMVVGDLAYQGNIYEVTIVPNEPDLLLAVFTQRN